jgi:hypothetical protein
MGLFDAFGRMDRPRNPSGVLGMLGLDRFFEPGALPGLGTQSGSATAAAAADPLFAQPGQGQGYYAYDPSWRERIQSGVQSGLENQGVSRALARDYGDKAETTAGAVPGVGQVLSANDFYRANRANDMRGMALSGIGMIPGAGIKAAQEGRGLLKLVKR